MKIAAQVYSVRDDMTADFDGTLKALKEMGYDGVELPDLYGQTPEHAREVCDKLGLEICAYTASYENFLEKTDEVAAVCKVLGCKYVGIAWIQADYYSEEKMDETVNNFKRFCKDTASCGLSMMYHNHNFEFRPYRGEYTLDYFLNAVGKDNIKAELDLGWVSVGGCNPVDYVYKYADNSPCLHVKNYAGTFDTANFEFRPVGYGAVDWVPVIDAMLKTNTEWLIIEQDNVSLGKTALESMKMSFNYVRPLVPFEK